MRMTTNQKNPYPGPRPFTLEEKHLFFGREAEVEDLFSLVVSHRILLVYSQSGAGKTSLIHAGLVPKMLVEGFDVLPVARVGGGPAGGSKYHNPFALSTAISWTGEKSEQYPLVDSDLPMWISEYCSGTPRRNGAPLVIILDQFEELFTTHLDYWSKRRPFLEQLCALSEVDESLRIVLVMREDYIAQLDPYVEVFPNRLRTRLRLERLGREAGLLAVEQPLEGTGVSFAPGVAEQLIQDLMKERVDTGNGQIRVISGEYIEPVQLQVVCHSLWSPELETITPEHLASVGNIDRALSLFYDEAVAASIYGIADGPTIRTWCETELITSIGTRNTVYRGQGVSKGLPNEVLDSLEARHLIRPEWRAGARWYELSHDRFIDPIRNSNRDFFANRSLITQTVTEALALLRRDVKKASSLLETSLTAARDTHDLATQALCLYGLAVVSESNTPAKARTYYLQALSIFEATSSEEGIISTLEALALLFRNCEEYKQEIETYSRLLSLSEDIYYLESRAAAYWYAGRLSEALDDYNYVISARGEEAALRSARGQVLVELGEYEAAANDLSAAAESAYDLDVAAYARAGLAQALAGMGQYTEAEREFEKSISVEPDNAWVYFRRGMYYEQLQQPRKALADYQLSLQMKSPRLIPRLREHAREKIYALESIGSEVEI
jgi:tetratricopeptide (TPR) repeat protein